ncbi:kinetochore scaffold 1-like [Pristis pectinata]|uniref:kinetochore scaffold 1-like n=1 Tax=Pristis pectinata TaxID=685728 RepID=UPI00223DF6DC|nr:kinetochore scaffold 1-like [Pristis pectinata]
MWPPSTSARPSVDQATISWKANSGENLHRSTRRADRPATHTHAQLSDRRPVPEAQTQLAAVNPLNTHAQPTERRLNLNSDREATRVDWWAEAVALVCVVFVGGSASASVQVSTMDENCSVFPEANAEVIEGKCKRRQSGILKASRSPLRTLKETDISQKMEPVGKLRRSSRRVSFADTKEVKEFVTDKMIMQVDVENDENICMLECRQNMEIHNSRINSEKENHQEELGRDVMQQKHFRIAGMDALLHAPLRTPLQQLESSEPIETVSTRQIFPISGLEVRRESEETVTASESELASGFQKKIDFKSFLAELDSTKLAYSNSSHDAGDSSIRQNTVPKHQKTIDFKSFLNSIKHTEADENKMMFMPSIFEKQVFKQADLGVTSNCEATEMTNNSVFQNHTINNLDANKTILFLDHDNDMEITRSHTVSINNFALVKSDHLHTVKELNNTQKLGNRGSLNSSLPQDKAVVFPGEDCIAVTGSVTVPIDIKKTAHPTNQNQPTVVTANINERSMLPLYTHKHTVTGYEYLKKIEKNKVSDTTKVTSRSLGILSSFPDKTQVFSNENDMDMTKSHTVTIDSGVLGQVSNYTVGSSASSIHDKTMVFSEANDMDITQSHTVAIESDNLGQISNEALQSTRKSSRLNTPGSILTLLSNEKTVVFSEANDMDITKSHKVTIDRGSLGRVPNCTVGSSASLPSDKTMVFSEANDMDITQSHTVAIESDNLGQISNEALQSTRKSSRLSTPGSILASISNEKTVVFSEANDMDITKSHTVTIESGSLGRVPNCTVGSSTSLPSDKTMVFSEANDMDITQSHTVAIESDNLGQISNKALQSTRKSSRLNTPGSIPALLSSEKTVVFSEANDMDITKSHTVTIESGSLGRVPNCTVGSSASLPSDKTMVFSEANDMDITQSHTVAIESDNLGQISNKALQSTRKSSRLNTPGSIPALLSSEKTVVFSEANDMDITKSHTVTIESGSLGRVPNCTVGSSASLPSDKTMVFSEANDMDITQSHTVAIESDNLGQISNKALQSTRKSSRLNTPGSIPALLSNEKTVVFSEANDMDITKSHTVTIESGNLGRVPNCTVGSSASLSSDKTMMFSEINDMDITQSHTVTIEDGNFKLNGNHTSGFHKMTSSCSNTLACFPNEKTMIFSKVNDKDIAPSPTVAVDRMNLGAVVNCAASSSTSFPGGDTMVFFEANDMDMTRSHTVAIEGGCLGPAVKLTTCSADSFPSDKTTIFSEANDMDVTKSYKTDIDIGNLGAVANGAFCCAKMSSDLNAVQSSFSIKNTVVSEQVAAVTKNDILPIHGGHDESGKHKITEMVLVKGQKHFSDQMDHANCSIQSNLEANSMCITGPHEKRNLKGIEYSLLCTENSSDATLTHKSDLEVQKRTLIDQTREAVSEELVQYQVTECAAHEARTKSASTTTNNLECNASRKSSVPDVSFQKLNSMTDITSDPALGKPPVDGNGPADCQTFTAKPCFPKQNSFVKDTLSQISLGVFLPKLPSRRNLCRTVNSNHQNVVKPSVENLCSDSLLNAMPKSEELERSNVFEPIGNSQEQPDGQNKMQVTDCDDVESRMLDRVNPSLCLKSSEAHTLAIHEQQCREALSAPEQGINETGQVPVCSKISSTVEQSPCQKRAWSEEENGNACNKRKMLRTLEQEGTDSSRKEVKITALVQGEGVGHETVEENLLSMTTKSLDSNSSLDSTKGDGTSAHAITPKCNLNASLVILEESELHQKLMDGEITVREFFKFLKVQTRAQKSRQSELQVNPELDRSSELENWLAVKFIHRPKREVYEEDSSALSAAINDLKDQLLDLDKLLSEVNLPLLKEVMQMTKEELQQFRSCLNTKKTTFVKRTKVICHEQKVQLYLSQLNALKAQRQQRKEYEDSLDDVLHKMDDCLASLDLGNLDHLGECSMDVIDSDESLVQLKQIVKGKCEDLKNLQAEHCKMESQLAKVIDEKLLWEKAANMLEINEEFQELLEWTVVPCQDDQALYRFLYDSLELTLQYGEPECADLSPGEKCRRIIDIKLVSELDEKESPVHSKLVHELVMMYWKNQESLHCKHSNESQLPMLLLDLSLVVSRCRLLGDELEYLLNWGSKFDILKMEIQHTDVKFLISSYEALSKFEVTFHITPGYPWLPLQFTFNSWFGNISGKHINEVLLTVKPGHKYLIRIMKSLFMTLLIRPGANRLQLQHASP